jgi:hypothetical protein
MISARNVYQRTIQILCRLVGTWSGNNMFYPRFYTSALIMWYRHYFNLASILLGQTLQD